jgi:excinuclease ABC subunit C
MVVAISSMGMGSALNEQRRNLPDSPGVYLFRDRKGGVLYVGKAKSIRKRVGGHFSNRVTRGDTQMVELAESIDFVSVSTEAEALLAEQEFIKRYKPRFNIRLRDDKSYPYIAISMDEEFPRVYFTRERHRRDRLYFGPYSSAKRTRSTLDTLGKIFMYRSCNAAVPGRRSGSPCLDYYIRRCGAPCVGYVSHAEYRTAIDGVIAFLQGRYKEVERDLETRMKEAAAVHEFEQAAVERNRLQAVRALLERQRVANASVGSVDAVGVAVSGTDANAQVFQVRDGVLSDRQSFYLANEAELDEGEVLEEFLLQYYTSAPFIPPQVVIGCEVTGAVGEALADRRGARVEVRVAERGDKKRILDLATRNAKLALETEKLKVERSRQQRTEALDRLQQALGLDTLPLRIECFDISNLMGTHTTASMVVFEGGAPKKSDYRRFVVRGLNEGVPERQQDVSPHDPKRNESFATLPNVIVIDGGPGQLSAGMRALAAFVERGVTVISLAKRIEEIFVPGRGSPIVLPHDTPELQLLQRVRDEAHRFAITHHRTRRDKAMTESILDGLPGIGPTRKRALLKHFGSPEAVLGASREELEAVPGVPSKVARQLHAHLRVER